MKGIEDRATALIPLCAPELNVQSGGRKAALLHELVTAGFPVPPGFVIAPDTDLNHIENALEPAIAALGGYPVAVRSSAQLEDLNDASFAGQYATRLEVSRLAELLEAIVSCRTSAVSQQAVSYLDKNGLGKSHARVSVLVQKQVQASVAGVTFSIHPQTGHEEHALLECCRGLGERLVSGQTSPTRYVLYLEDGRVLERNPGTEDLHLDQETLGKVCRYTLEIQAHFGVPQDVEWALDSEGEVWILQSRPITRIRWRNDVEEFTNANFRDGGVSARICTPFMYSLYRDGFQRSMLQYFKALKLLSKNAPEQQWISMFYGRPYWSASAVKKLLSKVPGYDEERFDQDLGIQKRYGIAGPARTPVTVRTVLRAIPLAIALEQEFRKQLRATENYGEAFQTQEAHYLHLVDSSRAIEDYVFFSLVVEVLTFHTETHTNYLKTVYNHVNYQTEFKKLLRRIEAATGEAISSLILMSGLQNISHMKLQQGFLQLVRKATSDGLDSSAWNEARSEFLSVHHFQGDAELDVSAPRWRECPDRLRQMVEGILQSSIEPKDPEVSARRQFELYSAEVQRVFARLQRIPWLRLRFQKAFSNRLRIARIYAGRREQMREYSMRADDLVRRFVLEAGRRLYRRGSLRREEDVFMLHTDELKALAHDQVGREHILAVTEFRRLMYRGYRAVEPPGELGKDVSHDSSFSDLLETSSAALERGIGCSAGRVIAKARVLSGLADSSSLRDGEIMVTRFTDPAWTPIMGLVAGVVTEVGGVLSHGAVIAREYGVPAVLNVAKATEIIKTGQILKIDGCNGTVEILDATTQSSPSGGRAKKPCSALYQIAR